MSQPVDAIPTEQSEQPQPAAPNNLPIQPTPLIGREQEAERVCRSLLSPDVRLLTLTGPPGVGKTRLSLHVASSLLSDFSDGVFFVNLAPISDHNLVASEVARTLEVREAGGQSAVESLKAFLRDKRMLLVLDNFEQVIEAAPVVAELAQASPGVKLLVTSRMRLQLRGEHEFQVPTLTMPPLDHLPPVEELVTYEAIRLFVERATAIKSDFVVTDRSASAVNEICHRLDGLPLAIELAAARVKILPAQAMLLRLQSGLQLLSGGAHDLPARQRTLRSAIAWSYDLLNSHDRLLFRRLAVFVGGRSLEAIEAVCNADGGIGPDVLESVSSLVDKSLLRQEESAGGESRFVMLETLHEYAREMLEESGEGEEIRWQHTLYFLDLAEKASTKLMGVEGSTWLARLDKEHDNFRAALEWSHRTNACDDAGVSIGLRMASALAVYWNRIGLGSEGREWMSAVLAMESTQARTMLRGRAVGRTGMLAYMQSDYTSARSLFEESLAISREVGDKWGVAYSLDGLGEVATEEGDYVGAPLLFEEALAIMRELGRERDIADLLIQLAWAAMRPGDFELAASRLEEALAMCRTSGDLILTALALAGLGEAMVRMGKYKKAGPYLEEALQLRREAGHKWGVASALGTVAWAALRQGDYERATQTLMESLLIRKEIGDKGGIAWCFERLADTAKARGYADRAATLFGAAKALRDSLNSIVDPADQPEHERNIADIRRRLGEPNFNVAWDQGAAMTQERAIAYALEPFPPEAAFTVGSRENSEGLTDREREIAALIAQSKSNAEIAEALVITKRTVETHIGNILSKLGYTSRGQVAAWAIKKGFVNDL